MVKSICVFGDSVSWGAWDLEKGGWVSRLWFHVAKRDENYVEVYNCSVSGGTSETVLARFESESSIREADALIFQTGGNDASYQSTPDNHLVELGKFEKNIQEIITRAKKITDNIIFMDLKNCDESKTMPVPWIDIYYRNDDIEKYRTALREICSKNGVKFLDLNELNLEDFDDGLHPNAQGHSKVFEQVKGYLVESGWI